MKTQQQQQKTTQNNHLDNVKYDLHKIHRIC
jgi:hypothetical protein